MKKHKKPIIRLTSVQGIYLKDGEPISERHALTYFVTCGAEFSQGAYLALADLALKSGAVK